ncbi:MAG TPA: nickel-dependent lactate racemase [Firmicutes bacterium]|nr:nickel-dependent lactate racemase [Bacillota bacterium]
MKVIIPYGKVKLPIEVEKQNLGEEIHSMKVEKRNEDKLIEDAIKNPIKSEALTDFLKGGKNILIIVNDGTRPTPTAKVLKRIRKYLEGLPFKFIIATGAHRAPTEEEYNFIFGDLYNEFGDRIYVHDAKKKEDMVYLGESRNGTPMWVNKLGVEADRILIIGSVEPHYFAGFTGGRKAFLPGIASYETIEANHKFALEENAKALNLENNPVHLDMVDAIKTIKNKKIFSIQTVLDKDKNIYDVKTGDINESFNAAIKSAKEVFCVNIKQKYDIVVTIAPYPMDVDLYQSQKAIDNAKYALNENGIMILISECRTGIGDETFFNLMKECETIEEVFEKIKTGYKLGYHKAAKIMEIMRWAQIWAVTNLNPDLLESILIKPFDSIQDAIETAVQQKGMDTKILFLIEGSVTIPIVSSDEKPPESIIKDLKF